MPNIKDPFYDGEDLNLIKEFKNLKSRIRMMQRELEDQTSRLSLSLHNNEVRMYEALSVLDKIEFQVYKRVELEQKNKKDY